MSSTSCACTITTSIITVAGNIAPLFSLFLSLHAPGCRRCGYLETVCDLPGSGAGNQRKRRLRARPLCTHASVSSRTPLAHLSPDNYRISARNSSPVRPHARRKARQSRFVTGQDNDGSRGQDLSFILTVYEYPYNHHFCESHYIEVVPAL